MQQHNEQDFPFNLTGLLLFVVFALLLSQALSPASMVVGLHLFAGALCLGGDSQPRRVRQL